MRKVIAIAGSDFHIHDFQAFNKNHSRLENSLKVFDKALKLCQKYQVPFLFCGDLYHTWEDIDNLTNSATLRKYQETFGQGGEYPFIAISGNHDQAMPNTITHKSPSHLDAFEVFGQFYKIDDKEYCGAKMRIYGIPYYTNEHDLYERIKQVAIKAKEMSKHFKTILLIHSDLPGVSTCTGYNLGKMEYINMDLFKPFDLVLSGHIHKPQKINEKVIMLGSPSHQNAGDEGIDMGLWKVYDDMSVEFVKLNLPRFISLKKGEKGKDDGNYYLPYREQVSSKEIEVGEFSLNHSKKKLAKKYCKAKGIKSKAKRNALIQVLNEVI